MDEITIIDVPEQTVLGVRKTGHYRMIAEFLPVIAVSAMERAIPLLGPPVFVMHEVRPEDAMKADAAGTADVEVAFPVPEGTMPGSAMQVCTLPGGRMARTFHRGAYDACEPTYLRLYAWLEEKGLVITGPMREVEHNDPREVPPEEILIPVG
ncbi:GyrI-like domain-containing protein [Methanoculleus sp. FWC-SCC1]|uniref:GyrI-like domain-containing protein n=1 Tax=Methanoculleus frigidifontis TaxID=2584085 RepID=A0ABT8M6A5_9EURY|nr:GyrI-like domain-containing protein [Methanoculleus sp. FWC-SCC1]MDN7023419.1 GyrI-like domain-containing protein [Methanoculleus sp. FWC-SCC1]